MGYDLVKRLRKEGVGGDKSAFMDVYGHECRKHMEKYGTTMEQLALIASKNQKKKPDEPQVRAMIPAEIVQVADGIAPRLLVERSRGQTRRRGA